MDDDTASHQRPTYEFVLEGAIDARRFRGLPVTSSSAGAAGCTVVRAALVDQPALYGFISRLRDRGLTLLELRALDATA